MDPNATLAAIDHLLRTHEYHEARDASDDLFCWINRGGFHPNWKAKKAATKFFVQRYGRRIKRFHSASEAYEVSVSAHRS